ncbi:MAG: hypothetical protein AB7E05_11085 [Sphingobium sp.]
MATKDNQGRAALLVGNEGPLASAIADRLRSQGMTVLHGMDGKALLDDADRRGLTPGILVLAFDDASSEPLADLTDDQLMTLVDRQLKTGVAAVRDTLERMREADYGRIVACVPSSGLFGTDRGVAQALIASALTTLIKGVAIGNLDRNICANILSYIAATPATTGLFEDHPILDPSLFAVDMVVPAVTYLTREECALNGEVVSAGAGRFAKVVLSVTLGGFAIPADEEIFAALLPRITDTRSTFAPRTVVDELITIAV